MYEPLVETFSRAGKPTEGVIFFADTVFQQNVCHVKGLSFSSQIAKDLLEVCLKESASFKVDNTKDNNPAAYFVRVCRFVATRMNFDDVQRMASRDVYAEVEHKAFLSNIEKLISNADL